MKEIKFRAWNFIVRRFQENITLQTINETENIQFQNLFFQQYTGLKDVNGKEIYEGDILKWRCSKSGESGNKSKIHTVVIEWESANGRGYEITIHDKINNEKWHTGHSYWNKHDREVIGNIYENQDLLVTD